jgi:hypothetical protein
MNAEFCSFQGQNSSFPKYTQPGCGASSASYLKVQNAYSLAANWVDQETHLSPKYTTR